MLRRSAVCCRRAAAALLPCAVRRACTVRHMMHCKTPRVALHRALQLRSALQCGRAAACAASPPPPPTEGGASRWRAAAPAAPPPKGGSNGELRQSVTRAVLEDGRGLGGAGGVQAGCRREVTPRPSRASRAAG